jgi:soluble lytic murein transglycosylase-like protein
MTPACPRFTKLKQSAEHSSFSFPAMLDVADRPAANSHARKFCRAICIAAAVALLAGRIVHAEPASTSTAQVAPDPVAAPVAEAAQRSGIPASWIRAVMQAESGGDARAVSSKGAMGLMQIMPETWATLRLRYGLGADPFDPHDNIIVGAAYLRELHDRYGSPGFLAAYNAGPARYEDHLATGQPLPAETR